jgi:flagellar protein FlbD
MIELTRLNGNPMVLNSDLIKTAEASPDTMLTLDQWREADCARDIAPRWWSACSPIARACWPVAKRLPSLAICSARCSLASLDVSGQPKQAPASAPK